MIDLHTTGDHEEDVDENNADYNGDSDGEKEEEEEYGDSLNIDDFYLEDLINPDFQPRLRVLSGWDLEF